MIPLDKQVEEAVTAHKELMMRKAEARKHDLEYTLASMRASYPCTMKLLEDKIQLHSYSEEYRFTSQVYNTQDVMLWNFTLTKATLAFLEKYLSDPQKIPLILAKGLPPSIKSDCRSILAILDYALNKE